MKLLVVVGFIVFVAQISLAFSTNLMSQLPQADSLVKIPAQSDLAITYGQNSVDVRQFELPPGISLRAVQATTIGLILADWGQTLDIAKRQDHHEKNPFLGSN